MTIDQIKRDIDELTSPGSHEVGSQGHDRARRYIGNGFAALGLEGFSGGSYELPYSYKGQEFTNVVAQVAGANSALPPLLLGGHYDSAGPFPGASDNASGVAVLLAVAKILSSQQLDRTVIFAFFDAEEPPHFLQSSMGSIRFYEAYLQGNVHCGIVLDIVGHDVPMPGLEDVLFITGMESDPSLARIIRQCEPTSGIRTVPTLNNYVGDMSDHHVFRINRHPYLLLTCGRSEHYHQPTDTPDKLNYQKIAGIAGYLAILATAASREEMAGPFEGYDTTDTELYFLTKIVQPVLDRMGLGLKLENRDDLDRLVAMMMSIFGI